MPKICNRICTNSEIHQENIKISIRSVAYHLCQGIYLSRCNARADWETTPLDRTLRGIVTYTGSRKCLPYSGWNRGIKICVCPVLHWQPPQCCFCVVLCILSRVFLRESFPGFETKCVVNLLFVVQCPVCHCSLWYSAQCVIVVALFLFSFVMKYAA